MIAGARGCTIEALDALGGKSEEELFAKALHLVKERPEMPSVLRAIDVCVAAVEKDGLKALAPAVKKMKKAVETATEEIARKAAQIPAPEDRILTFSGSGTVVAALLAAHKNKGIEVVACESRPGCEGTQVAEELAKAGVPTTLVVDAAAATELPYCQAVWVGADAITPNVFVNKVGTLSLALAAKHFGVPFFVISDSWKQLPQDRELSMGPHHPGAEVYDKPLEHLRIHNLYFEAVPRSLVGGFLTEAELGAPPKLLSQLFGH